MARLGGAERTARLIALLGQLKPWERIAVADLAEAVGTTEAELAADLETLSLCGIAPYDPYDLMPIWVEDGFVEVGGELPALAGPVRLSVAEAAALAAALQAAGFDAADPLTARLLDAAGATDFDAEELAHTVRTLAGAHDRGVYEALSAAVAGAQVVHIEHSSGGTSAHECREVEPVSLFVERGAWYLTAWCRKAGSWRTFRVDRIRSAVTTGERFAARPGADEAGGVALDPAGLPVARLRFERAGDFIEREWPGASVVEVGTDGSATIEVPFAGTGWIARHVCARLGSVTVLEPQELREAVVETAKAQIARPAEHVGSGGTQ